MNIEQLKQIIDNAPEGATHYDPEGYLLYNEREWKFINKKGHWQGVHEAEYLTQIRSLSDIKTIIELSKTINDIKQRLKPYEFYYGEVSIVIEELLTDLTNNEE